jgi:hypothetical protein
MKPWHYQTTIDMTAGVEEARKGKIDLDRNNSASPRILLEN